MRPGQPGFEKTVKAGYGLASDGRGFADGTPKNLYHLAGAAMMVGEPGARRPGFAELLFRLLTKRARNKGIDKKLEATYYREGGPSW